MPKTGYSNPNCYARGLVDCSKTSSREHYVSESVLKLIATNGVGVSGATWLPDEHQKQLPPSALSAKILCKKHNEKLSKYDDIALVFFRFLSDTSTSQPSLRVNGIQLERWMLKALCGLAKSGTAQADARIAQTWKPHLRWLHMLFGAQALPSDCGLYYLHNWRLLEPRHAIFMALIVDKKNPLNPVGLRFTMYGNAFLFSMEPPHELLLHPPGNSQIQVLYHPRAIRVNSAAGIREVNLGWPKGKLIEINADTTEVQAR